MTVETLIATVLHRLWLDFYQPRTEDFHRDKLALLKCVARFGYECNQRAWFLDADFITAEIMRVLQSMTRYKASIEYFPAYLDSALTRTIGQRAEELSAASKQIGNIVKRTTSGVRMTTTATTPSHVETLSALFVQLNRKKHKGKKYHQPTLF